MISLLCALSLLPLILASPLGNSEDVEVQFSIPFPEESLDYGYVENIREIENETQTEIKIYLMFNIKGKDGQVEEARRLVSQINTTLDQEDKGPRKQENQEVDKKLKDMQEKLIKSEREMAHMAEVMKNLKDKIFDVEQTAESIKKQKEEIVRIEKDEKKVEEAWSRVFQPQIPELDTVGKRENLKETQRKLNDIQQMLFELDSEKAHAAETMESLKTELRKEIHGLRNEFKENQKKILDLEREKTQTPETMENIKAELQQEIHGLRSEFEENQRKLSKVGVEMVKMSKISQKVPIKKNDSTDANLDDFRKSKEYEMNIIGRQPLHVAFILGRLDVVKKLIEDGADINVKDNNGWTPLHFSAFYGHLNLVKYLISNNVHINEQSNNGNTALMCAVWDGHLEVVKYLCSNKAIIHIKNKINQTALDIARLYKRKEMLEVLEMYA